MTTRNPTVFIPALLCDEMLYRAVIDILGDAIQPQVLLPPQLRLADSAADILARAPATFALVGTSYGAHLALEIALAAPHRVSLLWLMGCDGSPPRVDLGKFAYTYNERSPMRSQFLQTNLP